MTAYEAALFWFRRDLRDRDNAGLHQAAIRIVRLSAPFERFPDNIRRDTDIIHITRTWTFTRTDQVIAE